MSPARGAARQLCAASSTWTRGRRCEHEARDQPAALVFWQAFGEALALCRSLGWSPQNRDIFADTSGGPNVLRTRGPLSRGAPGQGPGLSPSTSTRCARTCERWWKRRIARDTLRSPRARWNAMTSVARGPGKATSRRSVALDEEVVGHASANHAPEPSVELREAFAPGRLQKSRTKAGAPPRRWWHRTGCSTAVFPMRRAITYP